ncbi:phage tail assembly protein [Ursidibacter arcticus]
MTNIKTITLKQPIIRGETQISEIQLRKPNVPALKGLKLLDLMQSDVNAISTLLPRITQPMLTKADVDRLDVVDFTKLTGAVFDVMGVNEEESESETDEGKSD